MLDHRHRSFCHEARDEALAAARDEHIDIIACADQFTNCGTVGCGNELDGISRQRSIGKCFRNNGGQRSVGFNGFMSAAQDDGVAGLDCQRSSIDGDVGTGFINHGDDAERHTHAADADARWHRTKVFDAADRISQFSNLPHARDHLIKHTVSDGKSVDEGCGESFTAGICQVNSIGSLNHIAACHQSLGDAFQCSVFLFGRRTGRYPTRPTGSRTDFVNQFACGSFRHENSFISDCRRVGMEASKKLVKKPRHQAGWLDCVWILSAGALNAVRAIEDQRVRARKRQTLFNSIQGSPSRSRTVSPLLRRSMSAQTSSAAARRLSGILRAAAFIAFVAKTPFT